MQIQYKPKRNIFQTILQTEILQGMALTLRRLFSKPITREYPQEKPEIRVGFRGKHALVRDQESGKTKCVACMRCVMVCPSRCIKVRFHTHESGRRVVDSYAIDALRCIYCAYCVEVCPVDAIVLTEAFEYSSFDRDSLYFDMETMLGEWDRFIAGKDGQAYVNPFWRQRGMPEHLLTADKRREVPPDWTIEGQYVGPKATIPEPR